MNKKKYLKGMMMEQLVNSPYSLGKALQRQRKLLKMNQKQAGALFGVAQSGVSSLENGTPGITINTLFRMLAVLDLEMLIRSKPNRDNKNHRNEW